MDQLQAMRVFVGVVDAGSFAGAADALGLSRTMASKHVRDLEEQLGARLLNRTTRRVSLTGAGGVYAERCREILAALDEADHEAALQSLTPRGRLRINAPMSFGVAHIAPLLDGYMRRYGEVEVDLVLNDRFVDLVEEGYDLAIRIGALANSSLVARRLATTRLVACAAPAYLARAGTPLAPVDLAGHVCLGYSLLTDRNLWRFADPARPNGTVAVRVTERLTSNNGEALKQAACSGLGVILEPDFIVHDAIADGRLVEILPAFAPPPTGVHALYPHHRQLSARVRTFIDYLVAAFGGEAYWAV